MLLNELSRKFRYRLLLEYPEMESLMVPDSEPGTFYIEIPAPSGARPLWISTANEEVTIGFGSWHAHYYCWDYAKEEESFVEPIDDVGGFLSGRLRVATYEIDGQWKGSVVLEPFDVPEEQDGKTLRIEVFDNRA